MSPYPQLKGPLNLWIVWWIWGEAKQGGVVVMGGELAQKDARHECSPMTVLPMHFASNHFLSHHSYHHHACRCGLFAQQHKIVGQCVQNTPSNAHKFPSSACPQPTVRSWTPVKMECDVSDTFALVPVHPAVCLSRCLFGVGRGWWCVLHLPALP